MLEHDNSDFLKDVDSVNETLENIEREVRVNDCVYFMRIVPYRTKEQNAQGIIITFVNFYSNEKTEGKSSTGQKAKPKI